MCYVKWAERPLRHSFQWNFIPEMLSFSQAATPERSGPARTACAETIHSSAGNNIPDPDRCPAPELKHCCSIPPRDEIIAIGGTVKRDEQQRIAPYQ